MTNEERKQRYLDDARRFTESNPDECMLCGVISEDCRTLVARYFYDLTEQVPEMIALQGVPGREGGGFSPPYLQSLSRGISREAAGVAFRVHRQMREADG